MFYATAHRFQHILRQALTCFFRSLLNCFLVHITINPNIKHNALICFIVKLPFASCARLSAHNRTNFLLTIIGIISCLCHLSISYEYAFCIEMLIYSCILFRLAYSYEQWYTYAIGNTHSPTTHRQRGKTHEHRYFTHPCRAVQGSRPAD